jgi:hypothetical protein
MGEELLQKYLGEHKVPPSNELTSSIQSFRSAQRNPKSREWEGNSALEIQANHRVFLHIQLQPLLAISLVLSHDSCYSNTLIARGVGARLVLGLFGIELPIVSKIRSNDLT